LKFERNIEVRPVLKTSVVTWSVIEANTGIMCASFLCIKPLVMKLFPRVLESNQPARRNMEFGNDVSSRLFPAYGWSASTPPTSQVSGSSCVGTEKSVITSRDYDLEQPSTAKMKAGDGKWELRHGTHEDG
jgi:hypothetical protein